VGTIVAGLGLSAQELAQLRAAGADAELRDGLGLLLEAAGLESSAA